MRFKSFKSLTLGKLKEKPAKDDADLKEIAADRIAKMENRIYGRTKHLEEKAKQLQGLSGKPDKNSDTPIGPHGPIGELTLEADEKSGDLAVLAATPETDDPEDGEEEVKLVEVSAITAAPPEKVVKVKPVEASVLPIKPPEKEKEIKPENNNDSIGNLFSHDEEEVNPLANLINALPDVTARELIDDIKEIKRIIKEWQPK
jgi:hypothetical protein